MSLWNKPVANIAYQDVEVFCRQKHKEGPRLDYKREFTAGHVKLICAFANTLGGIMILGVDGDKNNQPIWPPEHGLTDTASLEDRIVLAATDGIYPPVRPHVGPILSDPASAKSVMIVRVDESLEAPHAVDSGRQILVYERVKSVNKPHAPAHIDRIKYLLDRRHQYERDRETLIQAGITRGRRYLDAPALAVRWASIIPVYPWRYLCDPEICYHVHFGLRGGVAQRVPDGSFAVIESENSRMIESISAHGHMLVMEYPNESSRNAISERYSLKSTDFLGFTKTKHFAERLTSQFAKPFFGHSSVELPGFLQFDVGFLNVVGKQMFWSSEQGARERLGRPFPNLDFRAQAVFSVEGLMRQNAANEQKRYYQIQHGFDLFETQPRDLDEISGTAQ
jgi:hypothetical protein